MRRSGGYSAPVTAALLEMLFANLPRGLVLTLINALLTAFLLREAAPFPAIMLWLCGMVVVSALRGASYLAYRRHPDCRTVEGWRRLFVLGATSGGLAWGSAALLLLPTDSVAHQVFLGFVLAGMGAGAMASLVFDKTAYGGYVVAAILPYGIVMLAQASELPVVMGILALLFVAAMLAGGRTFHAAIVETLKLRYEREELASDLGLKAEELAETNRQLKAEIDRASAAEAQMREAKEQALAASRAKSVFLANMSHEIRTPINGVLGMTELLMRTPLDERQKQLSATLRSSGTMLLSIIEDVLDLSRIEAGKLKVTDAPFNPRACAEDALVMLGTQAHEKGLDVRLDVGTGVPEAMLGDADRLRQVIVNLLANAIKFTSEGSVVIRLAKRQGETGENRLVVNVSDTGIGIARDALERILKPFEQADASTNRRFGGTGLGLAISHNIVALMGGSLRIESEPGHGTTVTIDLPLRPVERRAGSKSAFAPARLDGIEVLVAEDNPVNQIIAREYLEELGCSVDIANDGNEAIAAFERKGYDIVLMDCQMPGLDGLEATIRIRQIEGRSGRSRTPIVALTANAFDEDRDRSLAAGMDDHVNKPYSAEQLANAVSRWVAGGESRSTEAGRDGADRPSPHAA